MVEVRDMEGTQNMSQTQAFQAQSQPHHPAPDATLAAISSGLEPAVKKFYADTKEVFVGRHPDCKAEGGMQALDKHVSGRHLRIYRDEAHPDRFYLEELGPSCYINSVLVKKGETRALLKGDKITIATDPNTDKPFAQICFWVGGPSGLPAQEGAVEGMKNGVTDSWVSKTWDISHTLGSGHFSEVRLGMEVKDKSKQYAVKVVEKQKFLEFRKKRESVLSLNDEADLMMSLDHPNIVKCYTWFQTEVNLYIALELVEGGDLLHCLLENGHFAECQASRLFWDVCGAVQYLHEKHLVHRDLKPENILLTSKDRETMIPKLADFGLARKNMENDCRTFCGTPHYFAPELISTFNHAESKSTGYGKPVDMWSLGVILYILLSGIPPFEEEGLYQQIVEGKYEFDEQNWKVISMEAKELVQKMMTVNPKERISIHQALEHPWLAITRLCTPTRSNVEPGEGLERAAKRRRSDVTMA